MPAKPTSTATSGAAPLLRRDAVDPHVLESVRGNQAGRDSPVCELVQDGEVLIAVLQGGPWHGKDCENQLNWDMFAALSTALDKAEESQLALVITSKGKWFSNGLCVEAMEPRHGDAADEYVETFYRLLGRFLSTPVPVVAAINGHAFAGGFLLAMSCDFRVMTDGLGLLCMPEVDMQGRVQPGRFAAADRQMLTVLQNKLPPLMVRDIMLQGKRLAPQEAHLRGIIDDIVAPEHVLPVAIMVARRWAAKQPTTFGVLKREISRDAIAILDPPRQSRL